MFVINQMIGSFLVHPDWDEIFRQTVRYLMLVTFVGVLVYIHDVKDILETAGGISYV